MNGTTTNFLRHFLDRLRAGDPDARQDLLDHSQERLRLLTHKMLRGFPGVRRWEDTDDVLQNVLIRLDRMLRGTEVASVADYLRLAATHLRRELIDLARHYQGPEGLGAHHATPPTEPFPGPDGTPPLERPADSSDDPQRLLAWGEFHHQIDRLPDGQREAFDLHWYQGLTHDEAAEVLGVSVSTFKRRWQAARLSLVAAFGGKLPFLEG